MSTRMIRWWQFYETLWSDGQHRTTNDESSIDADVAVLRHRAYAPPGPLIQTINRFLHSNQLCHTLITNAYWTVVLGIGTPIVILYLTSHSIYTILWTLCGLRAPVYEFPIPSWPKRRYTIETVPRLPSTQYAILVTGCDSGFGRDIAIQAAMAGFVVFAGCLHENTLDELRPHMTSWAARIHPLLLDVTNQQHVDDAAQAIRNWLQHHDQVSVEDSGTVPSGSEGKQRLFHALVNNAGIGTVGELEWLNIDDYQRNLDGMFLSKFMIINISALNCPSVLRQLLIVLFCFVF
jgi:hypothetical protein